MTVTRAECVALDAADPLAGFRDRFILPDGVVYLDGNSLGPPARVTAERIRHLIEDEWGGHLVSGWLDDDWMRSPRRVGAKVARLLGAEAGEVVIADSTSVCLFKAVSAALRLRPGRRVVVTTTDNFPADLYVLQGLAEFSNGGLDVRVVEPADVIAHLDDTVAALVLTHVDYRSGFMHDMPALTAKAHAAGALAVWDLCHSAGAVPVDLDGSDADFAVGCGYKYLNGGPGAPAFLFAATRHHEEMRNPISGWLGHADPFLFDPHYTPEAGIGRMISGSPSVMSIASLECGLDVWLEADAAAVRHKSLQLTDLFITLVEERCADAGFRLLTPHDHDRRGSQVAFAHPDGYGIVRALIERRVIGDFRAPDVCRFGFTPLYLRFADVYDAVDHLCAALDASEHRDARHAQRLAIT